MAIRQLPQSVINKIAAGEVIERPASVVKELVENSLDAGATQIDVSIEQGGVDLIRVTDNGSGIAADELPLAVASHATSKLATADDLFSVRSLGFRGEALASIAEVSRLLLRSRTPDSSAGAELEVNGGARGEIVPAACSPGTTIEVRNLFFNTPVRRKFLRSTQTEIGHIGDAFTRLALAYPQVRFSLRHNGKPIYELPPSHDLLERIGLFFGRELADDMLPIESRDGDVRLSGYVARPSQSRSQAKMQYLFLNGRHIRDRALQHALSEAYRGLLLTGRYPIAMLRLDMPAELVDVNVHPTKLEVRFQDGGRVYSQLLGTLRSRFLTSDLTHRLEPVEAGDPSGAHDDAAAQAMRQKLVDWAKGQTSTWTAAPSEDRGITAQRPTFDFASVEGRRPLELNEVDAPRDEPFRSESFTRLPSTRTSALQIHNRYLVTESEEGVVIIDQHALHERILYEKLRETVLAGALETQNLLVPEPVDLAPGEAALVLEHQDLLARLGIKIESFGGDTVLISSCPAMVGHLKPAETLHAVIEQLRAGHRVPDRRDLVDELLHMISCKAAIKAGDRLTPEEIDALLESRHLAQDAHHCPHGRPTALVFTRDELDKQFMRT